MMLYDCRILTEREKGLGAAAEAVERGELVVLPTESVYGLGADAFKNWSVSQLGTLRGSTADTLPVLIPSRHTLDGLTASLPEYGRELIEAFWPGPLSIVVTQAASLAWTVGDEAGRVMVRMPLHPIALELLRRTGPMVVTGANRVGQRPPLTGEQARDQLGYSVAVYLEAGECHFRERSTIVDVTGEQPVVLRRGAFTIDALREVVPDVVDADR